MTLKVFQLKCPLQNEKCLALSKMKVPSQSDLYQSALRLKLIIFEWSGECGTYFCLVKMLMNVYFLCLFSCFSDVASVTGAPEMLGGRVKTLHPAVHAG